MDVRTLLLQQWASCLDQEDWYPPLEKVLEDITVEQASWKPVEGRKIGRKQNKNTFMFIVN